MKVLVVGSGGREHAIVKALLRSPKVTEVHVAPGNGGISEIATLVPVHQTDFDGLVSYAKSQSIDLTVVGMDDPLVLGIVDVFTSHGLRIFGPSKEASQLEGSKAFSKNLMKKYGIPTASYEVFEDYNEAFFYCQKINYPCVIKADGLALGKGVLICSDFQEASQALGALMREEKYGKSGRKVVIEEYLTGKEVSILSFSDGKTLFPMPVAKDYKRALDKDLGLNTGGMGNISPVPYYTENIAMNCYENIFKKTIQACEAEGHPFKGILFFGLMLTEEGPKVIEYNCRFGDPETQALLPKLKTDIVDIFEACIDGRLHEIELTWEEKASVCVVLASGGYPEEYEKGYEIFGLDALKNIPDLECFHAATKKENDRFYTNGGRVLNVVGMGEDLERARALVYDNLSFVSFQKMQYRKDIGLL